MTTDKPHWAKFTPDKTARDWRKAILAGRPWRAFPHHYCEVRYESLVADPERTMQRIFAFLYEPWDPRLLDSRWDNAEASRANVRCDRIHAQSIGRWTSELSSHAVA